MKKTHLGQKQGQKGENGLMSDKNYDKIHFLKTEIFSQKVTDLVED